MSTYPNISNPVNAIRMPGLFDEFDPLPPVGPYGTQTTGNPYIPPPHTDQYGRFPANTPCASLHVPHVSHRPNQAVSYTSYGPINHQFPAQEAPKGKPKDRERPKPAGDAETQRLRRELKKLKKTITDMNESSDKAGEQGRLS